MGGEYEHFKKTMILMVTLTLMLVGVGAIFGKDSKT